MLLGLPLLALAYFLCAGLLPGVGTGDGAVIAGAGAGIVAASVVVLCVVWSADVPIGLVVLFACGATLLVGVLDEAGARAGASMPEAVLAGALGVVVARGLVASVGPAGALAIPVFVALVDAWSVVAGPSSRLSHGEPRGSAELTMDLPSWGHALHGPAGRLGLPDALFVAAFATFARRLGLRPRASAAGMVLGLLAAMVVSVATDHAIPALPFVAVGYLLPNLDRLGRLVRPVV